LLEFLSQQHGLQQKFALVTLASKIVSQCEAQITLLPSFAFPLAEVSVSIIRAFPDFWKLLHGMLQMECPFVVPVVFQPGQRASKDSRYYKSMGFRIEITDQSPAKVENEEDYVNRLQGYMRLYAAILQADSTPDLTADSLGRAWTFLSHFLNFIPASRYSATALDAFLSTAGYRMYACFNRQFEKLLCYIEDFFLKDLKDTLDVDSSAVAARLERYIQLREYQREPKGRTMPLRDSSSFNRA
jgi:nucleoporin GLE1